MSQSKIGTIDKRSNEQIIVDKIYILEQSINVVEKLCLINLIALAVLGIKIFLL